MAEADEKISVVIKPTSAHGSVKYTLDTTPNAQVSTLKEMLAEHSSIPVAEQRLIYKGQILKDDHTLASYGIANEHVVHLVRSRAAQTPSSAPTSTAATITTAPNPAAAPAAQAAPSLGMMGGLSASPAELMGNPEMMAQMMNNPMVQSMLNNPELMRSMMSSNPAVQQLIERNPELGAMLNDPAVLRQSLQIASNPALMREHMRHADRAISNLESMPEGFNALRRMFETVQEPLMAAASEMDPMATLMGGTAGAARSTPANTAPGTGAGTQGAAVGAGDATPNAAPLPNPWAPAAPAGGAMAGTGAGAGMPPLGLGLGSAGLGGAAGRGSAGLPHIDMVSQMMQRPGMREMMSSMMSNPAFMDQILTMNPMLRQMVESTPGMRDMLTNPAMVDAMLNPATLQSLSSMQANNPQLQQIMQAMGGGAPGLGGLGGPGGNPDQVAGMLGMMEMLGGAGPGMGGAGGFGGAGFGISAPAADPQTQYAAQLTALADMGFTDTAANVRALQATGGNVHAAVDRLLSGM